MLDIMPETFDQIKARFPFALEQPIEVSEVAQGKVLAASKRRTNVFDFDDGMRMVVSIDKSEDSQFLHVSASGTEEYAKGIRDEGLDGFVEDVILRLFGLIGKEQPGNAQVMLTEEGVLHLVYEEYEL